MRTRGILLALSLFAITACGGSDDTTSTGSDAGDGLSAADQQFIDDAVATFDPEKEAPMTEDEARCIAGSMVRAVGAERLLEVGIKPEEFSNEDEGEFPTGLTEAEASTIVDEINECLDLVQVFIDSLAEGEEYDAETIACLEEKFDLDFLRRMYISIFTGEEDALADGSALSDELFANLFACPGSLGDLGA